MKYLMRAGQVKEVDRYSIEEIGIPSLVLMEKAADEIVQLLSETTDKEEAILAVCGTGNNGGDAAAAARILYEKGRNAAICLIGKEERATEEMKRQLLIARNCGVPVRGKEALDEYTIIIDGLFGIGLSREIEGEYREVIEKINAGSHRVIAVDVPSGIHADTGRVMGAAIRAEKTVTFGYGKPGLYLYPGCEYAGELYVKDIGFSRKSLEQVKPDCFFYDKEDLRLLPQRRAYSNKGSYGKLLIIGGAEGMAGACILAAKAALRSGAGLVKILAAKENREIVQTGLPEAMFAPWEMAEKELSWADAVVLGPGLSQSPKSRELFLMLWEKEDIPLVLDADGLNLLAKLGGMNYSKRSNVILTPHLKEMERLSGISTEEIRETLIETAKHYGRRSSVLVLKDARSVVSDGERVYLNVSGNHALAKGGSGDVLSGIIGGLLAQGAKLFEAASLGAYVHGLAAEHFVERSSGYSLLAGELTEELRWILP